MYDPDTLPTEEEINKADKPLNKPFRLPAGSSKKFGVYVKDGDKTKKVTFGDPNMEIRRDDPKARANFRSRHSCDTATDKTSARYWSCRMWEKGTSVGELTKDFNVVTPILKADSDSRVIWGWAYVSMDKGERAMDHSGEWVAPETLVKATTNFMLKSRTAKVNHDGPKEGDIVGSLPVTKDLAEALGIQSDREGWIVGVVASDETLKKVQSGELTSFSIGGRALKRSL